MKDADSSNVSHVSRKSLQCIDVTTPVISHVVEVALSKSRLEAIAMLLSLFSGGKAMLYLANIF